MKKPKCQRANCFGRVESIIENGTGIKKRLKKIEGLPRSAGAQRQRVERAAAAKRATVARERVKRR